MCRIKSFLLWFVLSEKNNAWYLVVYTNSAHDYADIRTDYVSSCQSSVVETNRSIFAVFANRTGASMFRQQGALWDLSDLLPG